MHSAFCPNANFTLKDLKIQDKNELHHIKDVLRLKKGQKITVFNGLAEEALCEIASITAKEILLVILSKQKVLKTTPFLILACAIPKRTKFETILEKTTELGIDEIIPLQTARTEIKIPKEKMDNKLKRYHTIAVNAAKQSKRATIPVIHPIIKFSCALKYLKDNSIVLMPSLFNVRKNLINTVRGLDKPSKISILIGPEGDFTEKEYREAHTQGCIPVTLGDTVLKVETAAISTVACLNFLFAKDIKS